MASALRCLLLVAGILGLAPGIASAAATVELDTLIDVLEIEGDAGVNQITTLQSETQLVVTGADLTTVLPCTGGGASVTCPLAEARMIAVDLDAGDDVFTSVAVTLPQSIAGRDGDDRLTGGNAADVLAGGNGNDTLEGRTGVDDYFGEAGNDTIRANDGIAERIA